MEDQSNLMKRLLERIQLHNERERAMLAVASRLRWQGDIATAIEIEDIIYVRGLEEAPSE